MFAREKRGTYTEELAQKATEEFDEQELVLLMKL